MTERTTLLGHVGALSEAEIVGSCAHRPFLRSDAPPDMWSIVRSLPALLLLLPLRCAAFVVLLATGYLLVCFTRCFGPSISLASSASDNRRAARLLLFRSALALYAPRPPGPPSAEFSSLFKFSDFACLPLTFCALSGLLDSSFAAVIPFLFLPVSLSSLQLSFVPVSRIVVYAHGIPIDSCFSVVSLARQNAPAHSLPLLFLPWQILTLLSLCRIFLFISGFYHIQVVHHGPDTLSPSLRAGVVVSNHLSFLDVIVLESFLKLPGFVAKESAAKTPLFGPFFSYTSCLMVRRPGEGEEGSECGRDRHPKQPSVTEQLVSRQKEYADAQKAHLEDGGRAEDFCVAPLVVFPEGTTTNGRQVLSFRSGAFVSGEPVQPIGLQYPSRHFSMSWETIPILWYLYRFLTQYHIPCTIHVLPLHVPSEAERADPHVYAAAVASSIADVLHVPVVDATYREKQQVHEAVLAGRMPWYRQCPEEAHRR